MDDLPTPARLEAIRINGDHNLGFGTLPAPIHRLLQSTGLIWLMQPPQHQKIPDFWRDMLHLGPAPVVNMSAPIVNAPALAVNAQAPVVNTPAPVINVQTPVEVPTPQLISPAGNILEMRQLALSEGRSTFENNLLHWREHGAWPEKRTPTDWATSPSRTGTTTHSSKSPFRLINW
ncbi:hypothetical protein M434DRAFT_15633 [Hypoxylon sp. CO27-5]|nr:hypothetical protein M434DRAFT_15633 [Hypoxylon sp. CO27-5]